ncbi:hypothetical protein KHA94_16255 [Bacillus sp. FJAT-49705]|uniref:Tail assembly chaperone n=1 Tax=Cytobacillus citreus TaxID=2833586 RepID=A0ABS5NV97_9BACI|nr:hypothetical protein [Cytobacillus citreus]MBS4191743.1 hypothetical protein [Cytobacillus citreus]
MAQEVEQEILDLDKFIPAKRIVKLAGKVIDVSKIPSEVILELAKKKTVLDSETDESFDMVFDLAVKICNACNPDDEITKKWLVGKTSIEQLLAMLEFIMKPLKDRSSKNGKNAESPSL